MSAQHTPGRLHFLRCELARFEREAAFNRAHYSEAEAHCWDVLAADARAAIAKSTLRICPACDLPPIGDCAFANCKREFAAIAKASGATHD